MLISNFEIQELAKKIVAKGFGLPALITLESFLPLHNLIAHLGELFEPLWHGLTGNDFNKFKQIMSSRASVENLINELELQYKLYHKSN